MTDRIGELIGNAERRAEWRALVLSLHEAALPGGPLEGYVFHGTSTQRAVLIRDGGMEETHCVTRLAGDDEWTETFGSHWGIPKVAAFYAEDLIESLEDPDLALSILAIPRDDLLACGPFAVDGQTLDCPLHTRLDRGEDEIHAAWEASAQDWEACVEIYGTLLVLGAPGPGAVEVISDAADLEALVSRLGAPAPGR